MNINDEAVKLKNLEATLIEKIQTFHDEIQKREHLLEDEGLHHRVFETSNIRLSDYDEFDVSLCDSGVEYILKYWIPFEDDIDVYSIFIHDGWDLSDVDITFNEMIRLSSIEYENDENDKKNYEKNYKHQVLFEIQRLAEQNGIKLTIDERESL